MNALTPMPRSEMHEKLVLSTLINHPDSSFDVPSLTSDHFTFPIRDWFEMVKAEIENGKRTAGDGVSIHALIYAATSSGRIEAIGGASFLAELYTYNAAGAMNLPALQSNVAILSEFRARRLAVTAATRILAVATEEDIPSLVEAISAPVSAISDALTDSTPPITIKELGIDAVARFEARARTAKESSGIPTLELIDRHLHGASPGRLWVIGAYPEGGKTLLASQIILDAATAGHACLFLTMEMPERDLIDRMIIQQGGMEARSFIEPISYAKENSGEGAAKDLYQKVQRATMAICRSNIRIQRPANRRLPTIIAAIRKAHREIGIKIAAVDYVQLIRGSSHDTKEGEVSEISHALQEVTQELGLTLLVLSQLNADGETKHGRVIEEDADVVLNIVQDRNKESETYKQHRHVLIVKDRHHGSGGTRVPLILDRSRIRFVEGKDETEQKKPAKKTRFNQ